MNFVNGGGEGGEGRHGRGLVHGGGEGVAEGFYGEFFGCHSFFNMLQRKDVGVINSVCLFGSSVV